MTLDVGDIHWVVHHKYKLFKVLHYARKFGNAAKEGLKRPSHWAAYYFKSKFLVSCTRTWHYPVGHTSNLTVTSRTDGTTEHTEDEGLDINICCSSNKSFNSPVVPLFRRANRLASSVLTLRSSKKTARNKTKRKMAHQSAIPWVMMLTFHLWNERLIPSSKEVLALEEIFALITDR